MDKETLIVEDSNTVYLSKYIMRRVDRRGTRQVGLKVGFPA